MSRTRTSMGVVAIAAASMMLSACGTTGGTPVRSSYTGPELSQERARTASGFAPGVDITIGEGDTAHVCTSGWFVSMDNTLSVLTAGHCAAQGEGTPVTFGYVPKGGNPVLDREETFVGEVNSTSYAEPYDPNTNETNIGIIAASQDVVDGDFLVASNIGGKITVEAPLSDISGSKGNTVCWYSDASQLETVGSLASCGTVAGVSEDQTKILVTPDERVKLDAQMAGAPATINNGQIGAKERTYALGVFTGVYKDHVIIENVYSIVAAGGTIVGTK